MNEEYLIKMYYDWLIDQVDFDDRVNLYESLLLHLFDVDFEWLPNIPLDENRAGDGLKLRVQFANSIGQNDGQIFLNFVQNKRCSLLEMFVAFADRLTQLLDLNKAAFFWMFIDNLHLDWATEYDFDQEVVDNILYDFMHGTVNGKEPKGHENPPVLFPCREVYNNMNCDLYLQANLYLKSY